MFLPHFDVLCDLLLDRCTVTWNLFVLYNERIKLCPHLFHVRRAKVGPWMIDETGLETIGHVQRIVHADWLRAFFNMVEPSGNL